MGNCRNGRAHFCRVDQHAGLRYKMSKEIMAIDDYLGNMLENNWNSYYGNIMSFDFPSHLNRNQTYEFIYHIFNIYYLNYNQMTTQTWNDKSIKFIISDLL